MFRYQKYNVYALPFFQKLQKSGFMSETFLTCGNFNILLWYLIHLIDDDAFVSAATADACFMVNLVCLFVKPHLLALLQDNYVDLVRCVFLRKLSGMREEDNSVLSTPTEADKIGPFGRYRYIGETQISAQYIGLSLVFALHFKKYVQTLLLQAWQKYDFKHTKVLM